MPKEHLEVMASLRGSGGKGGKVSFDDLVRPYYGKDYVAETKKAKAALDEWNPVLKAEARDGSAKEISEALADNQAYNREGVRKYELSGVNFTGLSDFNRTSPREVSFNFHEGGDRWGEQRSGKMDGIEEAVYDPKTKTVHTVDPVDLRFNRKEGKETIYGNLQDGIFNKEDPVWGREFSTDADKQFMSILEHEVGHGSGGAFSKGETINGAPESHLAKPAELINGLGKVNRERFLMTGKRFETEDEFRDWFSGEMGKEPSKRFEGFSEEARRTFRALGEKQEGVSDAAQKKLMDTAAKIIPAVVKKQDQEDGRALVRSYLSNNGLI